MHHMTEYCPLIGPQRLPEYSTAVLPHCNILFICLA